MRRRHFLGHLAATGALGAGLPPGLLSAAGARAAPPATSRRLDRGWRFRREDLAESAALPGFDDAAWDQVTLPHTARLEALVTGPPGSDTFQWQGRCWYRRRISAGPEHAGRRNWLRFDGAMNVADVWLDGTHLGTHLGGFTPFAFDISDHLRPGASAVLAVRLDNRDNPVTGPKPLADLDFNTYGGLYRAVHLVSKDPLHVTDPILADRPASGGVLVQCTEASAERALVRVQVHVRNADARARRFRARFRLADARGATVAAATSTRTMLGPGEDTEVAETLEVRRPALWHPRTPNLHRLTVELVDGDRVVDADVTRIGIRRFDVSQEGLRINGQPFFLRGTNRHQEHPYVGYALSDAAQYRDARRIKEAGFDYVRLSHYPHAPAFMDACDELGLVVMDCIPGWQYFNRADPAFTELQYDNVRRMVRRDRNHPCVLLWEASLNETEMPPDFIARTHRIAHEELPGDQTFTCGWSPGYDVFIQARQHGGCVGVTDRPCVVSEYGDWEYYAQNAGLDQAAWADLAPDEANSRQLRWHGERRLLQQATNFQEAHDDNRKTTAFADGLWVMFDYNRGYAPDVESSGCMDLFRLPKPSYHFFRSQRDASERYAGAATGPMVFIATQWTPASPLTVRVFSNAEEVALSQDGRLVARQRPDRDRTSTHLAHPPFTFTLPAFTPGTLEAVGFIGGRAVARHAVRTPGPPARLTVTVDECGVPFARDGKDMVFVHARLEDAHGTLAVEAWENVFFGVTGGAELVGANPYSSEAGIASALLQAESHGARAAVYAAACVEEGGEVRVLAGSCGAGAGTPAPFTLHCTTDGSAPTRSSPRYAGPLPATPGFRAALLVDGARVVEARTGVPRFRVAGSTAPAARQ